MDKTIKVIQNSTLTVFFFILLGNSFAQNSFWTRKADFADGFERNNAVSFTIGNKGYVGTGYREKNDFWEYDPDSDAWTQIADFPGVGRMDATAFSINGKGYVGTGFGETLLRDFWEYDPDSDTWTQIADFEGSPRYGAASFSIGSKGYVGLGNDLGEKDFWEYDPDSDKWTQIKDFGGSKRSNAVAFSIGQKGYVGTGRGTGILLKDFWEYDPDSDKWTRKADFAGSARFSAVGFSIGEKGYIGTGSETSSIGGETIDFWHYDPSTNNWSQIADFEGNVRDRAIAFSIENKGYVGTGFHYNGNNPVEYYDFWELTESINTSIKSESKDVDMVKIYPNPTSHHISIELNNKYVGLNCMVKIDNSLGQRVYEGKINQKETYFNVNSLRCHGLCIVRIQDNTGNLVFSKKLIIH